VPLTANILNIKIKQGHLKHDQTDCEIMFMCDWFIEDGSCQFGFGWGHHGMGQNDFDWGWGDWDWNNSGFDRGDLNIDLAINVLDIVSEAGIIVGSGSPTDFQVWAGDLNIDFQIDVLDIVSMVNLILSERVGYSSPSAILDDGELRLGGSIGGIQFSGKLISEVSSGDYIVSNNGLTVIFNISGQLATKTFTFDEKPEDIIVASSDGTNVNVLIATGYTLISSYPNPFNPVTEIQYAIENSGFVTMTIYNMIGQKVINLVSGYTQSGNYSIPWNGRDEYGMTIPSGTYLISLTQSSGSKTQKITLLK
jgi:hypothetical protein